MSRLSQYKAERDLKHTPEPPGSVKRRKDPELIFVIQRHKATRLHYDLRLEMEGMLKSWAVPKGPSLDPKHRRLAMMVEDHPFGYKDFEGVIPAGNYGAGIVEIWDRGTYEPVDAQGQVISEKELLRGLATGSIKFRLHGGKLKGEFALVHMTSAKDDNAWLLIKHRDEAVVAGYNSEEHVPADSPINKALARNKSAGQPTPVKAGRRNSTRTKA